MMREKIPPYAAARVYAVEQLARDGVIKRFATALNALQH